MKGEEAKNQHVYDLDSARDKISGTHPLLHSYVSCVLTQHFLLGHRSNQWLSVTVGIPLSWRLITSCCASAMFELITRLIVFYEIVAFSYFHDNIWRSIEFKIPYVILRHEGGLSERSIKIVFTRSIFVACVPRLHVWNDYHISQ